MGKAGNLTSGHGAGVGGLRSGGSGNPLLGTQNTSSTPAPSSKQPAFGGTHSASMSTPAVPTPTSNLQFGGKGGGGIMNGVVGVPTPINGSRNPYGTGLTMGAASSASAAVPQSLNPPMGRNPYDSGYVSNLNNSVKKEAPKTIRRFTHFQ